MLKQLACVLTLWILIATSLKLAKSNACTQDALTGQLAGAQCTSGISGLGRHLR